MRFLFARSAPRHAGGASAAVRPRRAYRHGRRGSPHRGSSAAFREFYRPLERIGLLVAFFKRLGEAVVEPFVIAEIVTFVVSHFRHGRHGRPADRATASLQSALSPLREPPSSSGTSERPARSSSSGTRRPRSFSDGAHHTPPPGFALRKARFIAFVRLCGKQSPLRQHMPRASIARNRSPPPASRMDEAVQPGKREAAFQPASHGIADPLNVVGLDNRRRDNRQPKRVRGCLGLRQRLDRAPV